MRSRIARAWPPKPSVQSTATSPGVGASASSTSATMIARCIPAGVLPDSTILSTSAAYRSGFSSLYFSWNRRGFFPA